MHVVHFFILWPLAYNNSFFKLQSDSSKISAVSESGFHTYSFPSSCVFVLFCFLFLSFFFFCLLVCFAIICCNLNMSCWVRETEVSWWVTVHGLQRLRHDCATKHTHSFNTLPDIIGQALMQAQMVDSCTSVCLEGSCWWC